MTVLLIIAGVLVFGLFAVRQAARKVAPEAKTAPSAPKRIPLDDWQSSIRLDVHPDYAETAKTLQREERRQRPEERRN